VGAYCILIFQLTLGFTFAGMIVRLAAFVQQRLILALNRVKGPNTCFPIPGVRSHAHLLAPAALSFFCLAR